MKEYLAITSVPVQEWGALYNQEEALRVGTIFQDLNKPFFAALDNGKPETQDSRGVPPEQLEREHMLKKIGEAGFVLDDVRLYLDTHPDDEQGLTLLKNKMTERKNLLRIFAEKFYPLTMDDMADIYEKNPQSACYCWQKGPMPWEGACV